MTKKQEDALRSALGAICTWALRDQQEAAQCGDAEEAAKNIRFIKETERELITLLTQYRPFVRALRRYSLAVKPLRDGRRGGAVMGGISLADDAAIEVMREAR